MAVSKEYPSHHVAIRLWGRRFLPDRAGQLPIGLLQTMEKLGREKRDILVQRIKDTKKDQEQTKEQLQNDDGEVPGTDRLSGRRPRQTNCRTASSRSTKSARICLPSGSRKSIR
jgi:Protein of unknown function (DUF2959)